MAQQVYETGTVTFGHDRLVELCAQAAEVAGADQRAAQALARATVAAESAGNTAVGVAHLFDYLRSYESGRIAVGVEAEILRPAPACLVADARNGLAQVAFDDAFTALLETTARIGTATLWIRNSYTCGELGNYPRRLAEAGLIAVACANSPALMSLGGSATRVLGTNPFAYAVPRAGARPFVIDQASSQTAYVNVRQAAQAGTPLPEGWAVGPDGAATTDPNEALQGALLPFGGHRGGNIALLGELLATLAGAAFSIDAAPFDQGFEPPGIGVFVLCLSPDTFPGSVNRVEHHLQRLHDQHSVRLPAWTTTPQPPKTIQLDRGLADRLLAATRQR
ncbi:Ldh family oxidoreductase [Streptomyces phyllanthi]|uniref:Ldh family oxidoreductase n=1 Tax=Streptomyces phyllanthi TaxID=1803180 RepID=A0A5N8VVN2_9ACTN|nr:Ldh family oxidoreductase [Streptomyces phyllanthi]MPY38726.1 Ldh family oxidoreductase [Streptomyces phyllanthi]